MNALGITRAKRSPRKVSNASRQDCACASGLPRLDARPEAPAHWAQPALKDLPSRQRFGLGPKWRAGLLLQHQAGGWRVFENGITMLQGSINWDKFYLEPYLKEVIRERKEREEWAKK
ncbi:uncharacterized protein LOC107500346 isoform X1 [Rousettus aegyptiacus]|uniref:uncharacterized protein LOC107500346 isoform X1 n=1 Tax=Rousettus aegyptiacus TaxID=9407 RepID=UPI0007886E89|nr:uncharacterized protein LOC107500346 isoform X1 [Rousettus aegyptiacus]